MGSEDSSNPDRSRKRTHLDPVDPLVAKGLRFNGFMGQTEHHYLNLRTIKLDLIKPQPQESLVRNERERERELYCSRRQLLYLFKTQLKNIVSRHNYLFLYSGH